jgi:hypothetical protein
LSGKDNRSAEDRGRVRIVRQRFNADRHGHFKVDAVAVAAVDRSGNMSEPAYLAIEN